MDNLVDTHNVKYPPVSVAMTTYNGEKFLAQQLNSILAQTVPVAEIIVCDDGSSDKTLDILKEYSKHLPLTFYSNKTKLGVAANFKKAVSLTSPKNYVALSDQDDIWLPEKIEKSLEELLKNDDGFTPIMIYSDLVMIDEKENILNVSVNNELGHDKYKHCLATLLFGNFVLGCTITMNRRMRDFFSDIPDNIPLNHDAWITLIGFSFGKQYCLPGSPIKYRKHGNNASFNGGAIKNRAGRILNHIRSLFTENNYLHDQIALAKAFYSVYHDKLSAEHQKIFTDFCMLENASYLKKKLSFEKAFKDNWICR